MGNRKNAWSNLQKFITTLFQPFMTSPPSPHIPELFIATSAPTYSWFVVETWARAMQSCDDAAQCFVEKVVHCKCQEDKQHEFLRFEISSPAASRTAIVFVDRRVDISQGVKQKSNILSPSPAQSPSETFPANDSVSVAAKGCASENSLNNQFGNHIELRTLTFPHHVSRPSAQYLGTLLQTTSAHERLYKLYSNQCYWFAHTVFESLQILHPTALLLNGRDHKKRSQYCGSDFPKADDVDTVVADFKEALKDFVERKEEHRRAQMAEQQLLLERVRTEGRTEHQEELERQRLEYETKQQLLLERGRAERQEELERQRLESETKRQEELERQRLESETKRQKELLESETKHQQELERQRLEYQHELERYEAERQQLLARIEAVEHSRK